MTEPSESTPKVPKVRSVPLDALVPYEHNVRTHPPAQVEQIAASIREFGWTVPILVDGNQEVIAGHGRLLAAQKLGLDSVPVIDLADLTPEQVRAYRIADNKLTENSGWADTLADELRALSEADFDVSLTGFTEAEVAGLLKETGRAAEDDLPDPPDPITKPGDLWHLGEHRIACGDATDADVVKCALGETAPHLMVTDPPYGVNYDASWRNRELGGERERVGNVLNDDCVDWSAAWELFPGTAAYVWHSGLKSYEVVDSLIKTGFEIRSQIIWAKDMQAVGRGHYHWRHEPCFYAVRKGGKAGWVGGRKQTTIWEIPIIRAANTDELTVHSTQKPVECMARPIRNNSKRGDVVYDPFLGSGTTLIAAQKLNRVCVAVELNPAYVDLAVIRWENLTGDKAVREGV